MTPSLAAACEAVAALLAGGVREVVLAPGSRSAPIAYAVLAAERAGRLRLHVRVDERSAAYLALGLAKRTGVPAAVVTTSGTAVANLHPAVLEAHHATVPLVVLSADRPAALRGSGANQTTTQPGLFAAAPRFEADLAPGDDIAARVAQAVAAAVGPVPGPVHVNLQLVEPLVPSADDDLAAWAGSAGGEAGPRDGRPAPPPSDGPSRQGTNRPTSAPPARSPGGRRLSMPARTVVLLGDLPSADGAGAVLAWAEGRGYPVLAEPFGPHPRPAAVPHGVVVAADGHFLQAHPPDGIVVVGRPTLSRPFAALVRRPGARLVVATVPGQPWRATARTAAAAVESWPLAELLAADSPPKDDPQGRPPAGPAWRDVWLARGAAVEGAMAADPPPWPSGPRVAREVAAALPDGALLFLGSSNAPRDLEIATAPLARDVIVVGNRGLAGIDGCVSTAAGLALGEPGRPAYALMGDLTLLHDANGLLLGPEEPRPNLTLVVVNDDGGGIFATLEPGDPASPAAGDFERLFGTPTGTGLEALCRAHDVRYAEAHSVEQLRRAVEARPEGLALVEVRVRRAETRRVHEAAMRPAEPAAPFGR